MATATIGLFTNDLIGINAGIYFLFLMGWFLVLFSY